MHNDFECVEELDDFRQVTLSTIEKDAVHAQVDKFKANLIAVIDADCNCA